MRQTAHIDHGPSSARGRVRWGLLLMAGALAAAVTAACSVPHAALPNLSASVAHSGAAIGVGSTRPTLVADAGATPRPLAATPQPRMATPTPVSTPAAAAPGTGLEKVKPNELGRIPVLEFHLIVNAEEDQWTITPDHFRQVLQQIYDAGYRPISMADLVDNHIDIPAGTSPVVLTFDDSSPGQFTFLQRDGKLAVDPNSAVGILEAFYTSHPDWSLKGIFFVLPAAQEPHRLFGQPEYEAQKLRYLVDHGFEIGNHTYWHQRLDQVSSEEVQRQIALPVKIVQQIVPGYHLRFLALPEGMWPHDRHLAIDGSYDGTTYHNDAILLVGSDPAPGPNDSAFDPEVLQRVQVFDHHLDMWLRYLAQHPDERYVSDGDPNTVTFPRRLDSRLNPASVGKMTVRPY